jgi:hypothetical protein
MERVTGPEIQLHQTQSLKSKLSRPSTNVAATMAAAKISQAHEPNLINARSFGTHKANGPVVQTEVHKAASPTMYAGANAVMNKLSQLR